MRILLLGSGGQLGWELERALSIFGEVATLDYPEVDFCRVNELLDTVEDINPDVLVNAAAYTEVDRAESEPEKARLINCIAPAELNLYAKLHEIPFLHYSTDYVFDGEKGSPYTEDDEPNPINVYGASKLAGEEGIISVGGKYLIFRTSWVFSTRKGGYVTKVLQWAKNRRVLRIVTDQTANPTWARSLAEATTRVLERLSSDGGAVNRLWGLYHLAGSDYCSRYDWAKWILGQAAQSSSDMPVEVQPAQSAEFPTPAKRPEFSALDCSKFEQVFGFRLPDWKTSTRLAMRN